MHIISYDSGLERTGFAVFNLTEDEYTLVDYGCIITDRQDNLQKRIHTIYEEVTQLVNKYDPEVFAIEELFFSINKTTAINVAQAQGAVLTLAGEHNISVQFIKPNEIKKAVTGYGNADKKSMEKMVMLTLELSEAPKPDDTVDAIACGITYCTMRPFYDRQAER